MNCLTELYLYIDIVLVLYIFSAKILFLDWYEKIVKKRDAQGGKQMNHQINSKSFY